MEKETLSKYLNDGYSFNKISKLNNVSIGTIKYWAKKYDLKSKFDKFNHKEYGDKKYCSSCDQYRLIGEFYKRRNKEHSYPYCKKCTKEKSNKKHQNFKEKMILYKGGQCVSCSYNKCQDALEFHHLNPNEKDFTVAQYKGSILNNTIKKELDKCILVCSNCHREIHAGLLKINNQKHI